MRSALSIDDDFLGGDGRGRVRAQTFARLLKEFRLGMTFSIECRVDEIDGEILATLHDVGLRHVLIGIESANLVDDRLYAKRVALAQIETAIETLRGIGIDFSASFIMFHPLSNPSGLR